MGTLAHRASRVSAAYAKAMADPAMQTRFADLCAEVLAGPRERFLQDIAAYRANWAGVVKSANIRID